MSTAVAYLMLALMLLAFLLFALSTATFLSSRTGGHKRTAWWSQIFGGAGFIVFAANGLVSVPFLETGNAILTAVISVAFALLGRYLLTTGLKAKRQAG